MTGCRGREGHRPDAPDSAAATARCARTPRTRRSSRRPSPRGPAPGQDRDGLDLPVVLPGEAAERAQRVLGPEPQDRVVRPVHGEPAGVVNRGGERAVVHIRVRGGRHQHRAVAEHLQIADVAHLVPVGVGHGELLPRRDRPELRSVRADADRGRPHDSLLGAPAPRRPHGVEPARPVAVQREALVVVALVPPRQGHGVVPGRRPAVRDDHVVRAAPAGQSDVVAGAAGHRVERLQVDGDHAQPRELADGGGLAGPQAYGRHPALAVPLVVPHDDGVGETAAAGAPSTSARPLTPPRMPEPTRCQPSGTAAAPAFSGAAARAAQRAAVTMIPFLIMERS